LFDQGGSFFIIRIFFLFENLVVCLFTQGDFLPDGYHNKSGFIRNWRGHAGRDYSDKKNCEELLIGVHSLIISLIGGFLQR